MTLFTIQPRLKFTLLPLATLALMMGCEPLEVMLEDDVVLRPIEGELQGDLGDVLVTNEDADTNATVFDEDYGFGRSITIFADNDLGETAMIGIDTDLNLDAYEPGTTITAYDDGEVIINEPGNAPRNADVGYLEVIGCSGDNPDEWDTDLSAREAIITLEQGDEGLELNVDADFVDEGELSAEMELCDEHCAIE